jgi:asparagine synthase (glutamine-hydrolysing)
MRGIVPDAILDRRDKIGYATPEKRWLHLLDPWVRQALGSAAARSIPCLSIDIARLQWDAIQNGKGRFDSRIWRWIDLIRWTGEFSVVYD